MKKIIAIAIVLALAIPAVMVAQTPDYYGYDHPDQTVYMELVENAIDASNISFDTQAHEDDYLDLIDDLYTACDASNWNQCIVVSAMLKQASANIEGTDIRTLVESLCDCTADAYQSSYTMLVIPADMTALVVQLNNGNLLSVSGEVIIKHFGRKEDCEHITIGDDNVHTSKCDYYIKFEI